MSATDPSAPDSYLLVQTTFTGPATYSLAAVAQLAGVHPNTVRHYWALGLFGRSPARDGDGEPIFDDGTLYELRRFESYRRQHGINRRTLRLICGLWRQIDRLEAEVRFLRGA